MKHDQETFERNCAIAVPTLPKGVRKVNRGRRTYWYFHQGRGTSKEREAVRLPGDPGDPAFWRKLQEISNAIQSPLHALDAARDLENFCYRLVRAARRRAKLIALEFDLCDDSAVLMIRRQLYRCAVTGVDLSLQRYGRGDFNRPFAPSLDRVDNAAGYTVSNTRITARITNFAMNTWGEAALLDLIGVTRKKWKKAP